MHIPQFILFWRFFMVIFLLQMIGIDWKEIKCFDYDFLHSWFWKFLLIAKRASCDSSSLCIHRLTCIQNLERYFYLIIRVPQCVVHFISIQKFQYVCYVLSVLHRNREKIIIIFWFYCMLSMCGMKYWIYIMSWVVQSCRFYLYSIQLTSRDQTSHLILFHFC